MSDNNTTNSHFDEYVVRDAQPLTDEYGTVLKRWFVENKSARMILADVYDFEFAKKVCELANDLKWE